MNYFKSIKISIFLCIFNSFGMESRVYLATKINSTFTSKKVTHLESLSPHVIFDEYLSMLLWGSALKGRIDVVEKILKLEDVYINYDGDGKGNTPLIVAIKNRNFDIALLLLNHPEIDVNAANLKKITPLLATIEAMADTIAFKPVYEKTLNIFKTLINKGANFKVFFKNGDSLLHAAVRMQNLELVKLIALKCPDLIDIKGKDNLDPLELTGRLYALWREEIYYDLGVELDRAKRLRTNKC